MCCELLDWSMWVWLWDWSLAFSGFRWPQIDSSNHDRADPTFVKDRVVSDSKQFSNFLDTCTMFGVPRLRPVPHHVRIRLRYYGRNSVIAVSLKQVLYRKRPTRIWESVANNQKRVLFELIKNRGIATLIYIYIQFYFELYSFNKTVDGFFWSLRLPTSALITFFLKISHLVSLFKVKGERNDLSDRDKNEGFRWPQKNFTLQGIEGSPVKIFASDEKTYDTIWLFFNPHSCFFSFGKKILGENYRLPIPRLLKSVVI